MHITVDAAGACFSVMFVIIVPLILLIPSAQDALPELMTTWGTLAFYHALLNEK